MARWSAILFLLGAVVGVGLGSARADWTGDLLLGTAVNSGTTLEIDQAGHERLTTDADFATKPFEQPIYWALRLGWEGEQHGWALDLHHHKLYLENPPPEVQNFTITHGYNLVSAQHTWLRSRWRFFALLGVVVAHPESVVRGEKKDEKTGWFHSGYEAAGPVVGGGIGSSLSLGANFEIAVEGRVTWSTVGVDVAGGRATLDNLALHLLIGPRLRIP